MTCSQCGTILTPGDKFCAVCGAPASSAVAAPAPATGETVPVATTAPAAPASAPPTEAPVTRLSIAKPTAEAPAAAPAGINVAALLASPLVRRVAIIAAAAIVVLILIVALIPRGSGPTSASDDGTAGIDESSEGASPDGADPSADSTSAPTSEATSAPAIPPHYSPAQGAFAPVDPGRFAVAGYEGISFLSPSGNVGCAISNDLEGYWGCAINEHGWAFESDSSDDYCYGVPSCGGGIEATGSAATHPRAAEQSSFPAATALAGGGGQIAVLQYGELVNYGNIICYAESLGITCQNAVSGHGFTIARDRNELY